MILILITICVGCGRSITATKSVHDAEKHVGSVTPMSNIRSHTTDAIVNVRTDTFPKNENEYSTYLFNDRQQRMVDIHNGFAFNIYRKLLNSLKSDNIALSPICLGMNLEMLANGVSEPARREIFTSIGLNPDSISQREVNEFNQQMFKRLVYLTELSELSIANSIWTESGIKLRSDFINACREYYFASIFSGNLSSPTAKDRINKWMSSHSRGTIPQFLKEPLPPTSELTLINTLYFNSRWEYPFDTRLSKKRSFHNISGNTIDVDMVCSGLHSPQSFNIPGACFRMLSFPYVSWCFEMIFILPDEGKNIADCLNYLTPETFKNIYASRYSSNYLLYLPKFSAEYKNSFRTTLQAMGLKPLFKETKIFGSMMESSPCKVSDIMQGISISIYDEQVMPPELTMAWGAEEMPDNTKNPIVFDRPFMFMIVDRETGLIMFIGDVREL